MSRDETPPGLTQATARKALGQHFLFDPDILKRTALAAGPVEGRTVIEVGPGPGGLTRALLDQGAGKVIAVEADERFAEALQSWPEAEAGRLYVILKDARKVRWEETLTELGASMPAMIIANLPYNVGTPLLVNWLKAGAWRGEMALMFQKEVAERVCAKPNTNHYGRLAVLTHAVADPHIAFTLPPAPSGRRQRWIVPSRCCIHCPPNRSFRISTSSKKCRALPLASVAKCCGRA